MAQQTGLCWAQVSSMLHALVHEGKTQQMEHGRYVLTGEDKEA